MNLFGFFEGINKYMNISCYSPVWVSKMLLWRSFAIYIQITCETMRRQLSRNPCWYYSICLSNTWSRRQAEFPAVWLFEGLTASGEEMLHQKNFVPGSIRYLCSSMMDIQFFLYFDSSHVNTLISLRRLKELT